MENWEYLLLCESTVTVFSVPAAESDPRSCTHWHQSGQTFSCQLDYKPYVFQCVLYCASVHWY